MTPGRPLRHLDGTGVDMPVLQRAATPWSRRGLWGRRQALPMWGTLVVKQSMCAGCKASQQCLADVMPDGDTAEDAPRPSGAGDCTLLRVCHGQVVVQALVCKYVRRSVWSHSRQAAGRTSWLPFVPGRLWPRLWPTPLASVSPVTAYCLPPCSGTLDNGFIDRRWLSRQTSLVGQSGSALVPSPAQTPTVRAAHAGRHDAIGNIFW